MPDVNGQNKDFGVTPQKVQGGYTGLPKAPETARTPVPKSPTPPPKKGN